MFMIEMIVQLLRVYMRLSSTENRELLSFGYGNTQRCFISIKSYISVQNLFCVEPEVSWREGCWVSMALRVSNV